jgi:hypothetical protein
LNIVLKLGNWVTETFTKGDFFILILLVGIFSILSYVISYHLKIRNEFSISLFGEFLRIREPLTEILSGISARRLEESIQSNELEEWRGGLSRFYYQHYDLLPPLVLNELLCLINCIERNGDFLFIHNGKRISCMKKKEIEEAVYSIGTTRNFRTFVFERLGGKDVNHKRNIRLIIQTRLVLFKINTFFSLNQLIKLSKNLTKEKNKKPNIWE